MTGTAASILQTIPHGLFSLVYPDECRLCNLPLTKWTRVPVCEPCLSSPAPLESEFVCARCATPFANGFPLDDAGVCGACRAGLRGFDRAACFGFYEGGLKTLIHLFKYEGMKPLALPLARLLHRALSVDESYDAIVPVPLHWRKKWERGFNQSEALGQYLAEWRRTPLIDALKRSRPTAVQASLAVAGRRKNVAGAFRLSRNVDVRGKRILLIDDVMTTGATAGACAKTLKRAGAASVALLTLARVDRRLI